MHVVRRVLVLALAVLAASAQGQIRIGQSAGHSGTVAISVKEATDGARLYFDAVNARGGIGGQKIELISMDDKFDPKLTLPNTKALIEQGVIAMFLNRGTPHTEAIMPLLLQSQTPLVGPSTGAMSLHQPVHPYVFNVRATYQREAEKVVMHLGTVGVQRIAVIQVDDSFGADAATGALRGFAALKSKPVVHEKYDRTKPDFGPIIPKVMAADAQAVLYLGSIAHVIDGMKALRAAGSKAQMLTLSNNASGGFVKALGPIGRGVVVSQVFPSERSLAVPIIKEATDLARAKGMNGLTPAMVEGFAAAKVLVEGLKRAGKSPTRASLTAALESLRRVDIGGLEISYSPNSHTGLDYADLSIIGPDGRFMR